MIIHICDCCGKQLKDKDGVCCALPEEEEFEATNQGTVIAKYHTGKYFAKGVELCPTCAEDIASFFELMKKSHKETST